MRVASLRWFLDSWPYHPSQNVRLAHGVDGRDVILVRQPMGLEEYEIDGRPDGKRVHGMESVFHFHHARISTLLQSNTPGLAELTAEECTELFDEGLTYYQRLLVLFRLNDWTRVKRDAARTIQLMDFVKRYASCAEDRVQLEQWRRDITRINAAARALSFCEKSRFPEALQIASQTHISHRMPEAVPDYEALPELILKSVREALAANPALRRDEESLFKRQNDYWTIRYQGQSAFLKGARGLDCLACLLREPGREFHVTQLFASLMEPSALGREIIREHFRQTIDEPAAARGYSDDPILDPRAKLEYKRRLDELRHDLREAEECNNPERASAMREEIDVITRQLAVAVGLGGRDRKTAQPAERARTAVTKRIKTTICRIAEAIPSLGQHLTARIKTGYYCSYNPNPDRPVRWSF